MAGPSTAPFRDETARGSAQDDNFYINQSLKLKLYFDSLVARAFWTLFYVYLTIGKYKTTAGIDMMET
jgi:hypothetical protein